LIGSVLFQSSYQLFAIPGTIILMVGLIFVGIMTVGNFSYQTMLERIRNGLVTFGNSVYQFIQSMKQKQSNSKRKQNRKSKKSKSSVKTTEPTTKVADDTQTAKEVIQPKYPDLKKRTTSPNPTKTSTQEAPSESTTDDDTEFIFDEEDNEGYLLPNLDLLNEVPNQDQSAEMSLLEDNAQLLEDTFQSFGVNARVVDAKLGPAVTKYEVQPDTSETVSKNVSLSHDIALALAAKDIRMEATIPGKSLIGIEVSNSNVSMVSFREVIEDLPRRKDKLLEVPIGRNIAGNIQIADLSKMPHLLIAGATGSGKSVGINGIICSILLKAKPNEVKLMMIDPKMVELNIYNGIPHLLTP